MMGNYFGGWPIVGWHLHFIFGILAIVGAILFVIWASRELKKNQLYNLAIILVIIGLVGLFLTMGMGVRGFQNMVGVFYGKGPF